MNERLEETTEVHEALASLAACEESHGSQATTTKEQGIAATPVAGKGVPLTDESLHKIEEKLKSLDAREALLALPVGHEKRHVRFRSEEQTLSDSLDGLSDDGDPNYL